MPDGLEADLENIGSQTKAAGLRGKRPEAQKDKAWGQVHPT